MTESYHSLTPCYAQALTVVKCKQDKKNASLTPRYDQALTVVKCKQDKESADFPTGAY